MVALGGGLGVATPSLERTFRGHRDQTLSVSFSPNLKQVITMIDVEDEPW